jgi:hypothetical protein
MYHDEDKRTRASKQLTTETRANIKDSDETTHPTQPYVEMSFGMGTDGFPPFR